MKALTIVEHGGAKGQTDRLPKPMLFHFSAEWSGACRRMASMIEEIGRVFQDHVEVLKIDIDESRLFAFTMGMCEVPAFVLIKEDRPRRSSVGVQMRSEIAALLQSYM